MRLIIPVLIVLLIQICHAKIEIAILDTGISKDQVKYLCPNGLKSYLGDEGFDTLRHGELIAGILIENLDMSKYCLVSYKVLSGKGDYLAYILALVDVMERKPAHLNLSLEGENFIRGELRMLKELATNGTKIYVAAGNGGKNLNKNCDVYPACYFPEMGMNFFVVGAHDVRSSNHGKFVRYSTGWEKGKAGTSFAVPNFIVEELTGKKKSGIIHIMTSRGIMK